MSDAITNDSTTNGGITLPNNKATYNAGLSPLFIGNIGRGNYGDLDHAVMWRGRVGYFHSSVPTSTVSTRIMHIDYDPEEVSPSYYASRGNPFPLRCLVSTTNS